HIAGAMRNAGRGRLFLGQAYARRRRGPLRLAEGQIWPIVASRAGRDTENDDGPGSCEIRTRHERFPENEETRHLGDRARLCGEATMTATAKRASYGEATVTLTRVFEAPRALVWKAWTDPEVMAQWFGPRGFTNPVCQLDVRVGGSLHIVMRGPDGNDYPMKGVFREVLAPERLVFTNIAIDHEG